MAVVVTVSNHFKYLKDMALINMDTDTFIVILMDTTFAFDKDAHATLALVTANQLATAGGYTQDDKALSSSTVTEDDSLDCGKTTFANVAWTATAAGIGPTGAAIIYDDTTADKAVYCCIDFGEDFTITDGLVFQLNTLVAKTS